MRFFIFLVLLVLNFKLIAQNDTLVVEKKIGKRTITKTYLKKKLIKKHVYKFHKSKKNFNPQRIHSKIRVKEYNYKGQLIRKTFLKPVSSKPNKRVDLKITRNENGQWLEKEKIVRKNGIPVQIKNHKKRNE